MLACTRVAAVMLLGLVALACHRAPVTIRAEVDVSRSVGPFDRLSGVQGSPAPILPGEPNLTEGFRAARIERSRFPQDCEPNTLTLGGTFPDAAADPDSPASYDFAALDAHVRAAREAGAEILWQSSYDVGGSDAWVGLNLGGRPPADLARWSRVLTRSLEHLNNGWAGGLNAAVRHVEFLNEPDGLGGFRGDEAARLTPVFLRFLETVEAYNAAHPDTPVVPVGPGIPLGLREWPRLRPLLEGLVVATRAAGHALPVFSFHTYGADVSPASNAALARDLRGMLDANGLASTALWNTEWQAGDHLKALLDVDAARIATATELEQRLFASGMAAYALASKMRWQGVITGSFYYRANARAFPPGRALPSGTLRVARFFAPDGSPGPLALQEQLTARIADTLPERCATTFSDDGLVTVLGLRAPGGAAAGVLVSNLSSVERTIELEWTGLGSDAPHRLARTALGPGTTSLDAVPAGTATPRGGRLTLSTTIAPLSTWLLVAQP